MLETLLELTLIPVSIDPHMHAVPIGLSELPLTHVVVSLCSKPHSRAMFESAQPLALVKLSVGPLVLADPLGLAIHVVPLVYAAIWKLLVALPILVV